MTSPGTTARRILVVDDEPIVCDSLTWMLAVDGHQVQTASNGQAALACFKTSNFDAVILDYELPDMKGDQLAAAIKSLDPHQPIVMLTGYPETLVASTKPLIAVDLIIGKPLGLDQLRQALARVGLKA